MILYRNNYRFRDKNELCDKLYNLTIAISQTLKKF